MKVSLIAIGNGTYSNNTIITIILTKRIELGKKTDNHHLMLSTAIPLLLVFLITLILVNVKIRIKVRRQRVLIVILVVSVRVT